MDANPTTTTTEQVSETMSPSEVENLLALAHQGEQPPPETAPHGETPKPGKKSAPHPHFPEVATFSDGELRKVRTRCVDFIRAAGGRLSMHLRLECELQLANLETMRFQPFVGSLGNPTHLVLFRLDPLPGVCLFDIPSQLALSMVDRELGGPGVCGDEPRELTPMEAKLAARVVEIVLSEWCNVWADILQFRPVVVRHETCGRFLRLCPPETMMVTLAMEVRLGQLTEQIRIAMPRPILEPILIKLNSDNDGADRPEAAKPAPIIRWNSAFDEVPIKVSARWGALELTGRQIMALKPGDIIPLQPAATAQVELALESTPHFRGHLGTCGKQLAVKVVETLKQ